MVSRVQGELGEKPRLLLVAFAQAGLGNIGSKAEGLLGSHANEIAAALCLTCLLGSNLGS